MNSLGAHTIVQTMESVKVGVVNAMLAIRVSALVGCFQLTAGDYCNVEICTDEMEGQNGPCKNSKKCVSGKCSCDDDFHGWNKM